MYQCVNKCIITYVVVVMFNDLLVLKDLRLRNTFHSGVYSVFDVEGMIYINCRSINLSTLFISLITHS